MARVATPALLTSTEAGRVLGKSARTIQRMADGGALPVAQKLPGPNGAYLFRADVIDRLAASLAKDAEAVA